MGVYLNAPDKSKELWLQENGLQLTLADAAKHDDYKDVMLVVLVENFSFSAAAIAYKREEKILFLDSEDLRPKKFYLVERAKLPEGVQSQLAIYQRNL